MLDLPPDVLDPAQLRRIEATHRGFLYQHLFAAGCLLVMAQTGATAMHVETDEDVELEWPDRRLYIQVKVRADTLQPNEIRAVLERFAAYRAEHEAGRRPGGARFLIVSSAPPSPALTREMAAAAWPADVELAWPDGVGHVPPAWPDLATAFAWCEAAAGHIPFGQLSSRTLVLKLAGLAQLLATGAVGHSVSREELPLLFEQLVLQLQQFPTPPALYRPQIGEPALGAGERVRLVLGVSGAGKTAWASERAIAEAVEAVYFDVGDTPSSAVASALAREIAARMGSRDRAPLAGVGLDLLRRVTADLRADRKAPTVVIDNVHRMEPQALIDLVGATGDTRLVLLGQPWEGAARVALGLDVPAASLGGWSSETIAAEFAANGAPVSPGEAGRVSALTDGAPLFVSSAARLAAGSYGGDAGAMLAALAARAHGAETAQEILLTDVFAALPIEARRFAAVLAMAAIPLESAEIVEVAAAAWPGADASALRRLERTGVAQTSPGGEFRLHDAFRLLAMNALAGGGADLVLALKVRLAAVLEASLRGQERLGRLLRWMNLLPEIGRTEDLTDIATEDFFQEVGAPPGLREALERIADTAGSRAERFWAMDALVFWASKSDDRPSFDRWVRSQARLVEGGDLPDRVIFAFHLKQMLAAGQSADAGAVERHFREARPRAADDEARRLVDYNHAVALFHLGDSPGSGRTALGLAQAWSRVLGFEFEEIARHSPWEERDVGAGRQSTMKKLADAIDLMVRSAKRIGVPLMAEHRWAMLLYAAAGAMHSAVKVGLDVVEDYLMVDDPEGARRLVETNLLPTLLQHGFPDLYIPLRAQYAAVLAFAGDGEAALAELARIAPFEMDEVGRMDFEGQTQLVAELQAAGWPRPSVWLAMNA